MTIYNIYIILGCKDVWTVVDDASKKMETNDDVYNSFMVLTHETGTMILQTGEEINEIENTGFSTNLPTIFVGNVGNNRYIVQVTTKHLRLLQGNSFKNMFLCFT